MDTWGAMVFVTIPLLDSFNVACDGTEKLHFNVLWLCACPKAWGAFVIKGPDDHVEETFVQFKFPTSSRKKFFPPLG